MESEATVIINGKTLNSAQSSTLRVAISSFHLEMQDEKCLGDDNHGRTMTRLYKQRCEEILEIIFGEQLFKKYEKGD